jgi:predicted alpha/beta-hydrolase family hydrolase
MTLLIDGPDDGTTFVFAHGAGLGMDAPFMQFFATRLADIGIRVVRFEFPFMQRRRQTGRNSPPDRPQVLREAWLDVLRSQLPRPVFIGGKSMGGRIASMLADEASATGLICLGYPFHPPGKPDSLRTEHLADLQVPTLVLQGERDPFGNRADVTQYGLSDSIRIVWIEDGDHSFVPRKSSGITAEQNFQRAVIAIHAFVDELVRGQ